MRKMTLLLIAVALVGAAAVPALASGAVNATNVSEKVQEWTGHAHRGPDANETNDTGDDHGARACPATSPAGHDANETSLSNETAESHHDCGDGGHHDGQHDSGKHEGRGPSTADAGDASNDSHAEHQD